MLWNYKLKATYSTSDWSDKLFYSLMRVYSNFSDIACGFLRYKCNMWSLRCVTYTGQICQAMITITHTKIK